VPDSPKRGSLRFYDGGCSRFKLDPEYKQSRGTGSVKFDMQVLGRASETGGT